MSEPAATLPAAPIRTRSRSPVPTSALCTISRPSVSGVPTWSSYSSGAAPVPPSEPSTMTKSGLVPSASIALQIASTSTRAPTHSLIPTGLPPASSRIRARKSTSSRGVLNVGCAEGLMHFCPTGTPRTAAISAVTFAAGSTPPIPGFAPCESLSETHLTASCGGLVGELVGVEVAVGRAGAEVAAAQLPHQVAAVQVVRGQTALTGVVGEAAVGRADVERAQGVGRQRPEAHRRDVEQRHVVGLRAVRAADGHPRRIGRGQDRHRRVHEVLVADFVDVAFGAERLLALDALRALVDDRRGCRGRRGGRRSCAR